jgi:hypothetical protein
MTTAAFRDAVLEGAFSDVAFEYVHPSDEMRKTTNFELIQEAFINAYT